jgi:hypothetical protein
MSFTLRSVDHGFADAMRWHLEPFGRKTVEQQAVPVDLFVQEEDRESDPAPYSFFFAQSYPLKHVSLINHLGHALWAVNRALGERARDFLLLHAGAITIGDGVVLLPAAMDSGKSSLVVALMEAGCRYLSDEFGAIDPVSSSCYPVPKSVHIGWETLRLFPGLEDRLRDREGLNRELAQRYIRPQDLGTTIAGPGPVGALVFPTPEFDGPPRLSEVSSAEAVELMATSSFNLFRYRERGVILLSRIAKQAPAFRLSGGTPRERAACILERID